MTHVFRRLAFIGLPVLTLILGWGLGVSSIHERLNREERRLDELYSGDTGSGKVVVDDPELEADIAILWDVWRKLNAFYIAPEELYIKEMVFGAVSGMVEAVGDPYTVFMTPTENNDFIQALNGDLDGIGAELTLRDSMIVVVAPLKNSPAAKAGLLPEDIITKVDDIDISGKRLDEVVQLIRGKQGTQVTLEVFRQGEDDLLHIAITRERVHIPSISSDVLEQEGDLIGYIELNRFDGELVGEVESALNRFKTQNLAGVIIDVRFNGGGLLDAAVDVVSLFLKEGMVVTVEHRGAEPESQFVTGQPIMPDIPLVILINEGSASASEILAGALQDHGRATVVGVKSFGKGTVQEIIDLHGGSSLRVTTARWLTPNGLNLGKSGVTPDIEVERTPEQYRNDEDPQLEKAVEVILGAGEDADDSTD